MRDTPSLQVLPVPSQGPLHLQDFLRIICNGVVACCTPQTRVCPLHTWDFHSLRNIPSINQGPNLLDTLQAEVCGPLSWPALPSLPPRAHWRRWAKCSPVACELRGFHVHTLGLHFDSAPFLGLLYPLLIPIVPTFLGPELKVLTTAAQIVLDSVGLPTRTGISLHVPTMTLHLSITLIQVYHCHF